MREWRTPVKRISLGRRIRTFLPYISFVKNDVVSKCRRSMRPKLKPILTLLLITPFLTELLSNNMAPPAFFNPLNFLLLATVVYGFPVLLLREFACRLRLGIAGLLCLGLVYGIINEGIVAKTFYLSQGVPVNTFDVYGYLAGISIPWAITISVWHSLHSVLCPILLTYYLFPDQRSRPWLNRAGICSLVVPTAALDTLFFFSHTFDRPPGQLGHYALMLICMGLLMWLATKAPRSGQFSDGTVFRLKPLGWGAVSFPLLLLVPVLLSKGKVAPWIFYAYFAIIIALIIRWMNRHPEIPVTTCLLFTVSNNVVSILWVIPSSLAHGGSLQLTANVLMLVAFASLLVKIWKDAFIKAAGGRGE